MFPLTTDTPFTPEQLVAITRVMMQIAHVDEAGTVEEVAMISNFYDGFRSMVENDLPEFESIKRDFVDVIVSEEDFSDMGQREMIAATCVMVALADGQISDKELSALRTLAERLAIPADRFDQIIALVKDHMLMQLAGLPDTESIIAVARELD